MAVGISTRDIYGLATTVGPSNQLREGFLGARREHMNIKLKRAAKYVENGIIVLESVQSADILTRTLSPMSVRKASGHLFRQKVGSAAPAVVCKGLTKKCPL